MPHCCHHHQTGAGRPRGQTASTGTTTSGITTIRCRKRTPCRITPGKTATTKGGIPYSRRSQMPGKAMWCTKREAPLIEGSLPLLTTQRPYSNVILNILSEFEYNSDKDRGPIERSADTVPHWQAKTISDNETRPPKLLRGNPQMHMATPDGGHHDLPPKLPTLKGPFSLTIM